MENDSVAGIDGSAVPRERDPVTVCLREKVLVTVEPQKRRLLCYVGLIWEELPERDERLSRDVRKVGHYGMGDTEIALSDASQLDYALRLIEAGYRKSRQ